MDRDRFFRMMQGHAPVRDDALCYMMAHIGDPDPQVRDDLVYGAWCDCLESSRIDVRQKTEVLHDLLDGGYLCVGLKEGDAQSVLTRSYTALFLAALLEDTLKTPWMAAEDQERLMRQTFCWLMQEEDVRGWDEQLGWVHAFAHGADLLAAIVPLEICDEKACADILEILQSALSSEKVFLWGEEDRLSRVLIRMFQRGKLSEAGWMAWGHAVEAACATWKSSRKWSLFLQSLYFKLRFEGLDTPKVLHHIERYLRKRYQDRGGVL